MVIWMAKCWPLTPRRFTPWLWINDSKGASSRRINALSEASSCWEGRRSEKKGAVDFKRWYSERKCLNSTGAFVIQGSDLWRERWKWYRPRQGEIKQNGRHFEPWNMLMKLCYLHIRTHRRINMASKSLWYWSTTTWVLWNQLYFNHMRNLVKNGIKIPELYQIIFFPSKLPARTGSVGKVRIHV